MTYNLAELAEFLDDSRMADRAGRIAAAIDEHPLDAEQGLWADLAMVGGESPVATTPISDGVMGALVTADAERARAALTQLDLPHRFGAPFGPTNVARTDAAYGPGMYWAECWDPETGQGLGAVPQSWTGLVVAMTTPA